MTCSLTLSMYFHISHSCSHVFDTALAQLHACSHCQVHIHTNALNTSMHTLLVNSAILTVAYITWHLMNIAAKCNCLIRAPRHLLSCRAQMKQHMLFLVGQLKLLRRI